MGLLVTGLTNAQIVNFIPSKLDRAWEVNFIKKTSVVDGFQNAYSMVNTGLLISSDNKNLYFVTLYYSATDEVRFSWTDETKTFNSPEPSKRDINLQGELINKLAKHDLMLFKTPRPSADYKPQLLKIGKTPKLDDVVYILTQDYNPINRVNTYSFKEGIFTRIQPDIQGEYLFVRFKNTWTEAPIGGGIIFNKDGELLGLIRGFLKDSKEVRSISGRTIENFVRELQKGNKDAPAKAPTEETD